MILWRGIKNNIAYIMCIWLKRRRRWGASALPRLGPNPSRLASSRLRPCGSFSLRAPADAASIASSSAALWSCDFLLRFLHFSSAFLFFAAIFAMHSSGGRAMDPVEAFKVLVRSAGPRAKASPPAKFVKKMDEIPSVELSPSDPCRMALMLSEKAFIGKFTGLWPNPKAVDQWINTYFKKSRKILLQGLLWHWIFL